MSRPRPVSAGIRLIVAIGLGAATVSLPGCFFQDEGRPAGSIEVKNAGMSPADVKALKAKTTDRKR